MFWHWYTHVSITTQHTVGACVGVCIYLIIRIGPFDRNKSNCGCVHMKWHQSLTCSHPQLGHWNNLEQPWWFRRPKAFAMSTAQISPPPSCMLHQQTQTLPSPLVKTPSPSWFDWHGSTVKSNAQRLSVYDDLLSVKAIQVQGMGCRGFINYIDTTSFIV